MKKIYTPHHFPTEKWVKILFVMKIKLVLLLCCVSTVYANSSFSQQTKFDVSYNNTEIKAVLDDLTMKTGYTFVLNKSDLARNLNITASFEDATLEEILDKVLVINGYEFTIQGRTVAVSKSTQQPADRTVRITGKVVDDGRAPMVGVTIIVVDSTIGVVSDAEGNFAITAQAGDRLMFSYVGYQSVTITAETGNRNPVIVLKQENVAVEEVVVVAHGTQTRESIVGAVSTVRPAQLQSSNSDLTASFAGNIAGMIAWQTGGIPGALTEDEMNTKFYIRGITSFQTNANIDPLILLDGVESSKLDLARIDPEDIESMSVLKDASATAMYGARGANGVILVTTKKGESGSVYTSARYEAIVSMPTREIDVVGPIEYMKLYNETVLGRNPAAPPRYTREQIENASNPDIPSFVYPANDWYETMFKSHSINHHMGVNIRGGSDVVQYYASLNYNIDNGMLKTDRLNDFSVNIKSNTMTLRINLNINLTKNIKLVVNSFSTFDKYHGPIQDVRQAYAMAFKASPVDFAVTYPADDYYKWNHIRFGGSTTSYNPYAELHAGYTDRMRYSTINRAEYIHNLDFITKGLEFRANASLSQEGYFTSSFSTAPYYYGLRNYDFATGVHSLLPIVEGSRVLSSVPSTSGSTSSTRMAFELSPRYNRTWDNHQLSSTVVFQLQENRGAMPSTLFASFPQRNISLAARAMYGYKERYFLEGSFGYNGSERFAKNNRMGFFPAIGGSWVISKENFMGGISDVLPFLKLRLSWGKVGNDGIISNPRFAHLSTINLLSIRNHTLVNMPQQAYRIDNYANPKVTWEVAESVNMGLDFGLFRGLLEFNIDAYREVRHNVLDYRTTVPSSLGLTTPALDNVGKVDSRGMELAVKVQHAFSPDLWVILNGTFTYSKAKFMEIEEATNKPEWQRREGRDISQAFGYIAEGLFQDQAEIYNSPDQGGNLMVGDIRYRDINDDGVIDVYDAVPIGFPETPRVIYGFNTFINYKNLEFSFAFQGMGQRSFFLDPQELSPFVGNNAVLQKIADDHWREGGAKERPFWPRMSTSSIIEHNPHENYYSGAEVRKSTYFMKEGEFLRCRLIELGYNLPKQLSQRMGLRNVKVYARVNNPFVISSFNVWDIELGSSGFNYPIQRTYSAGINVTF